MKKRKAPVLLITLLVVLMGGAVVAEMYNSGGQKPTDTPDNVVQEHPAPTQDELAKSVNKSATEVPMKKALQTKEDSGPSINVPSNEVQYKKPVPNGPTTDSQWYKR